MKPLTDNWINIYRQQSGHYKWLAAWRNMNQFQEYSAIVKTEDYN